MVSEHKPSRPSTSRKRHAGSQRFCQFLKLGNQSGKKEIDKLIRAYKAPVPGVSSKISMDDSMYDGNRDHYFGVGESALQMVKLALLASSKDPGDVKEILDLPSGFGRVLRTLRAVFPDASITACDILRDGVDYCACEFGARPVYSRNPIAKVEMGRSFDLIWCGSLLTHLDAPYWDDFLAYFESHLNPGGLLLFTVHGLEILRRFQRGWSYGLDAGCQRRLVEDVQKSGFGYVDYPNQRGYGISIADRVWVMKLLAGYQQLRVLVYCDRGWDDHQDIIACCRDVWQPPSGPDAKFDLEGPSCPSDTF